MGRGLERILGVLRAAWALPGTSIGLVLGAASLAKPRRDGDALIFESNRGFAGWLGRRGYSAITMGQVITAGRPVDETLRRHEGAHVWQWTRGGPVFAALYLLEGGRCLVVGRRAYADNLFERQARFAERA